MLALGQAWPALGDVACAALQLLGPRSMDWASSGLALAGPGKSVGAVPAWAALVPTETWANLVQVQIPVVGPVVGTSLGGYGSDHALDEASAEAFLPQVEGSSSSRIAALPVASRVSGAACSAD